ncbi:hypothetical protein D7X88_00680 [bacterium C-53]|nr:hypothetical protein [Lachnospiraceae bacterium]NBI01535.1 hypothetical protein [Lachnospiraceae bacterium]RKJ12840.1 hypothetical protein D7X88_00680 [bacterium C-53]
MSLSRAIYAYVSEKKCVFYSIDLNPGVLMEQIHQYTDRIKYQLSMEAWKQFKNENQSAKMHVRLITPVVYDFYESFELGSIEQSSIQIERAADKLCSKIGQEIVMDIVCSKDFRNMKVVEK